MAVGANDDDTLRILEVFAVRIFLVDGRFHLVTGVCAELQRVRVVDDAAIGCDQRHTDEDSRPRYDDVLEPVPDERLQGPPNCPQSLNHPRNHPRPIPLSSRARKNLSAMNEG